MFPDTQKVSIWNVVFDEITAASAAPSCSVHSASSSQAACGLPLHFLRQSLALPERVGHANDAEVLPRRIVRELRNDQQTVLHRALQGELVQHHFNAARREVSRVDEAIDEEAHAFAAHDAWVGDKEAARQVR